MKIKSLFSPIEEHAPMFLLQEDTLEGFELEANSHSTKESTFELTSPIMEVEKPILTSNEDEEKVLAMMDEGPKRSSRTSPKSLARLSKRSSFLGGNPREKKDFYQFVTLVVFVFSQFSMFSILILFKCLLVFVYVFQAIEADSY